MNFLLTFSLSLIASLVFGYINEQGHPSGYAMYPVVSFIPALVIALINIVFIRLAALKSKGGKPNKILLAFPLLIFILCILINDSSVMLWGVMGVGGVSPVNFYLVLKD